MDTERINSIRELAGRAAISDIARRLTEYVDRSKSVQQLREQALEVAYVLNYSYGLHDIGIDDYINIVNKELHGKEADKTRAQKSDMR
ncbi:MAG: hypothetical protein K6G73_12520 [Marinilabiliaceae bacterium]|nr:hypothetical protein [Marinilabiliaceae bacterium]